MKVQFSYRKIDKNEKKALRQLVADLAADLEEVLGSFDSDAVRLDGAIERHGKRTLYRSRLKLTLPGKSLAALEEAEAAEGALRQAFSELRHQVERYKHLARNDYLWKRPRRRAELRHQLKESGAQSPQAYLELIRPQLPELYHFIRRELAYHQALGDLSPGEITAEELLDSVLVEAYEGLARRPGHLELKPWLTQLALQAIGRELEAHRLRERRVATEEGVPEDPMEVTDGIDTELFEFYQPDEAIRMEDILPNPESPDPEAAEAQRERDLLVNEVLALLPRRWRHALVLQDIHELDAASAAAVLDTTPEALEAMRHCAEQFMRAWLEQRADELETDDIQALLGTPLREPLPDEVEAEILEKFMPLPE